VDYATPAHACFVYRTLDDLLSVVIPFLRSGLRRNERCWYVARGDEIEQLRQSLCDSGLDVAALESRGALTIFPPESVYASLQPFSPEQMMNVFNNAIADAERKGFAGFRAAGEMSWANRPEMGEELHIYETLISTLLRSCRAKGLCLFPSDAPHLKRAVAVHPLVAATDGELHQNPAFQPSA
jgi:hypothetical protein